MTKTTETRHCETYKQPLKDFCEALGIPFEKNNVYTVILDFSSEKGAEVLVQREYYATK